MIRDKQNRIQKVAVVIYTKDPEGNFRFLLRHNKPFNGYNDEWTICFGDIEEGETLFDAAKREVEEEFSIKKFVDQRDLKYTIEYEGRNGKTLVNFVALEIENLDIPITLNEESIGFDWKKYEEVMDVMLYANEKEALRLTRDLISNN